MTEREIEAKALSVARQLADLGLHHRAANVANCTEYYAGLRSNLEQAVGEIPKKPSPTLEETRTHCRLCREIRDLADALDSFADESAKYEAEKAIKGLEAKVEFDAACDRLWCRLAGLFRRRKP